MAGVNPQQCSHAQFTGYDDHCVCIYCGWIIEYDSISLERNDASLKNYIKTTLKQIKKHPINKGEVEFDVGVTTQGIVEQGSMNRIKFTILL